MIPSDNTILVIGATGQQGGAATRHLLADGWRVRALAHHPDSPAAQALAAAGVELVPGDVLDPASLDRAIDGSYGVFAMTAPLRDNPDPDAEVTAGENIADAVARSGAAHFVFDSVEGADKESPLPWVAPKHVIETYIRELGLPVTIWRPVLFMENYLYQRDSILAGKMTGPLWPESMTYLIATHDIGRFAALAFSDPERFIGSEMAIGGDAMPIADVARTFSEALGRPVEFEHTDMPGMPSMPRPEAGVPQHVRADVAACRELVPGLLTLRAWIDRGGWTD